jgi:hypothetical protein
VKKSDTILREYVRKISDDDLRFLNMRFSQTLAGDRAEVAEVLAKDKDVDKWLSSATCAVEWFDMLDQMAEYVQKENTWRFHRQPRKDNRREDKREDVKEAVESQA